MKEKYQAMSVIALKELAKMRGIRGISSMKKNEVVDLLVADDEKRRAEEAAAPQADGSEGSGRGTAARTAGSEGSGRGTAARAAGARKAPEQRAVSQTGNTGASQTGTPRAGGQQERRPRQVQTQRPAGRPEGVSRPEGTARPEGAARPDTAGRPDGAYGRAAEAGYQRAEAGYQRPEGGYQRPEGGYQRPESGYQRPEGGYQRPEGGYQRPEGGYQRPEGGYQRPEGGYQRPEGAGRPAGTARQETLPSELSNLDSGQQAAGILEVMTDGYGFIRCDNYLSGENDVYVSPSQIRKFGLKTGDHITGNIRVRAQGEKFGALLYVNSINGMLPSQAQRRYVFEDMTPVFPNERLRMERTGKDISMRIVDLISPIGKGQRGMIVSPPKAGKTTLLKDIARSILKNNPEMTLIIMLIDERPEEVTDIKEAITGPNVEVLYSTFDELPEHHKRVSEMGIERAKRLVEHNKDVTILLDSITRLARAYNLTVPPSGRTLSGGLDPAALYMPKRFFGSARNMREGGSLTILATALVDTGSKMDDVVYEEFKGTGNMELVLDRKLSERRVFPAIDIQKSGTRREDLLLDKDEQEAVYIMRKALNGLKGDEAVENILNLFVRTQDNHDLVTRVRRQRFV